MADFPRTEISRRLALLSTDLEQFPTSSPCPWPLARIFNELLKQAKRDLSDDPVVRGMRFVEEGNSEEFAEGSDTLTGTVRGLITQIAAALESQAKPAPAKSAGNTETAAARRKRS